ncbi:serine hydrolase [Pseudoclavibacter endophyticus]|uniref:Beta-lactamase family protein n=1 Tax=Pseudoclavibacter endophyticus TaxID=1778590 RepID=A0A6H9WLC9_9MICO|nr:serine hydrolase domain-containing protein [Pseudoclavibacter endophyticus]KAB1648322.1 beta-lactamase family protein [Pseudoclavibacter endophyticus]GGA71650.1 serine hydrolase [Pseudoclavibacter endophyticus]
METLQTETPQRAGLDEAGLGRVTDFAARAISEERVAGAVIVLMRRGRIGMHAAFGDMSRSGDEPMRHDAIFRQYSMTKPVVSVGLLQLYEEGRFQLTDPLELHLPELAGLRVHAGYDESGAPKYDELQRSPTVLDAMRHTPGFVSGIGPTHVDALYRERGLTLAQSPSLSQAILTLGEMPLLYQPGERWVYGLGHDVQAHLIERLSGRPLDAYLTDRVFRPLGMIDTAYGVPDDQRSRVVDLHGAGAASGIPTYERFADRPFGTIGLWGTTIDFARFGEALRRGGELDGERVLARKTVELMCSNHLPPGIDRLPPGSPAPGAGYGLGVSVTVDPASESNLGSPGTFGWFGAATTRFLVDPREEFVAVFCAQQMPSDGRLLAEFQTVAYGALV